MGYVSRCREVLRGVPISSFIASLLASKDSAAMDAALQLAEILMGKLPDIMVQYFVKEGVVHAIDQLAGPTPEVDEDERPPVKGKAKGSRSQKRSSSRNKNRVSSAGSLLGTMPRSPSLLDMCI